MVYLSTYNLNVSQLILFIFLSWAWVVASRRLSIFGENCERSLIG